MVERVVLATLMHAFLEFHSHMLMSGHKITSLLKREMVDEHKAKVFDELTNLKKKYEVDQKSWTKDNKDP